MLNRLMDELPPQPEQAPGQEQEPTIEAFEEILAQELVVATGEQGLGNPKGLSPARVSELVERVDYLRTAGERLKRDDFGAAGRVVSQRLGLEHRLFDGWSDELKDETEVSPGVTVAKEMKRLEIMQDYAMRRYAALVRQGLHGEQ